MQASAFISLAGHFIWIFSTDIVDNMLRNSCFFICKEPFCSHEIFSSERSCMGCLYLTAWRIFFLILKYIQTTGSPTVYKIARIHEAVSGKKTTISSFKNIFIFFVCNFPNGPFSSNVSVICKLNFSHRFVWHFSFLLGYDGFITIHIYMVTCGISKKCLQNCKNSWDYEWEKFRIYFLKIL